MRRLFSVSEGHALSNHVARRGLLFAAPALLALIGTIGAAAAVSGSDPTSDASATSTPSAYAPVLGGDVSPLLASFELAADAQANLDGDPSATPSASPSSSATATPTDDATSTATPTASASASAALAAHTNGHGCDDIIHADDEHIATFGGPVGCEVGNSAAHRQNGLRGNGAATATPTDTATATPTASATADATATPTPDDTGDTEGEKEDPHANGQGCDDVMFVDGVHIASFGGPVGCEVGNSAAHRQNGLRGNGAATATPTDTANETPTATPTDGASLAGSLDIGLDAGVTTHGNSANAPGRNK